MKGKRYGIPSRNTRLYKSSALHNLFKKMEVGSIDGVQVGRANPLEEGLREGRRGLQMTFNIILRGIYWGEGLFQVLNIYFI